MQTVVTATRPTTHSVIRLAMPPPPAKSPRATGRGVKNSSRWQYQPLAGVRRAHLSLSAVDAILGDWRPPVSASDDEQACKKRKRVYFGEPHSFSPRPAASSPSSPSPSPSSSVSSSTFDAAVAQYLSVGAWNDLDPSSIDASSLHRAGSLVLDVGLDRGLQIDVSDAESNADDSSMDREESEPDLCELEAAATAAAAEVEVKCAADDEDEPESCRRRRRHRSSSSSPPRSPSSVVRPPTPLEPSQLMPEPKLLLIRTASMEFS